MSETHESALEQLMRDIAVSLREHIQRHDRFVVVAFLFSCLPLPPACFAGLLLGFANACLLKAGRLGPHEWPAIKLGLLLGIANSLLALLLTIWLYNYLMGANGVVGRSPAQVIDWLHGVFHSWSSWRSLYGVAPERPI